MSGHLRKWRTRCIVACLIALGASLCYEEETEYARNIYAGDDPAAYGPMLAVKRRVRPAFGVEEPVERVLKEHPDLNPHRFWVVERYYLFGLITDRTAVRQYICLYYKCP